MQERFDSSRSDVVSAWLSQKLYFQRAIHPNPPRPSRANVKTVDARSTWLVHPKWSNAANIVGWFTILTLTPLRTLSRLIGSTNSYWHDTWYTSGKYSYITLSQLLSKLLISYSTLLPLLSNCLSKLPIQVPYKFRVESPASIIITAITYTSGVDKINDIESFLPHS